MNGAARTGRIAILAAGASSRMGGRDKLLEPVAGVPLLACLADRALATAWPVIVTLPAGDTTRRAALGDRSVEILAVSDAASGMAASFRALSRHGAGALLVMLGDLPEIETAHLRRMIAAHRRHPGSVIRATGAAGRPGQPVLFPASLVPAMAGLSGDRGARALLAHAPVVPVALPRRAALTDLDTPQDWAAWRGRAPDR